MTRIRSLLIFVGVFAATCFYLFYLQPHDAPACDGDLETKLARNLVTRAPGEINKRVDMPNIGIDEIKVIQRLADTTLICQAVFTYDQVKHGPLTYKVIPKSGLPPIEVEFVR